MKTRTLLLILLFLSGNAFALPFYNYNIINDLVNPDRKIKNSTIPKADDKEYIFNIPLGKKNLPATLRNRRNVVVFTKSGSKKSICRGVWVGGRMIVLSAHCLLSVGKGNYGFNIVMGDFVPKESFNVPIKLTASLKRGKYIEDFAVNKFFQKMYFNKILPLGNELEVLKEKGKQSSDKTERLNLKKLYAKKQKEYFDLVLKAAPNDWAFINLSKNFNFYYSIKTGKKKSGVIPMIPEAKEHILANPIEPVEYADFEYFNSHTVSKFHITSNPYPDSQDFNELSTSQREIVKMFGSKKEKKIFLFILEGFTASGKSGSGVYVYTGESNKLVGSAGSRFNRDEKNITLVTPLPDIVKSYIEHLREAYQIKKTPTKK